MTLSALPRSQRDALITAFERSCTRVSSRRKHRLVEILRRNVFGTEHPKPLYTEFRISKQRFFIERNEVLRRLGALVDTTVDPLEPVAVLNEPSQLKLTQARALYGAGNASASAALFESIDDRSLAAGDRFDAFRMTIDALDESGVLALHRDELDQRIRRWNDASTGTSDQRLATAAGLWLRMRLGHFDAVDQRRSSLALEATGLVRQTLSTADRATVLAYGRILTHSIFIFLDEGHVSLAESQLRKTRELTAGDAHLASVFAAESNVLHSAVHWFEPAKARLARVERRTAYHIATQNSDVHTAWACLYFEIRDQLAQTNFAGALTLAQELFRGASATGNGEWQRLARGMLIDAYLLAGRLDDARRMSALASRDSFLQALLNLNLACKVASMRRDFPAMLELSTAFVKYSDERNQPSMKAAALRHQARAAYHTGAVHAAVSAIEDAVAVCESHRWTEPWDLQRTYNDAARITGRRRYREALTDIISTLYPQENAAESQMRHTAGLSERELQTARLATTGLTNDAIGRALGISSRTVEKHLDAVFGHFAIQSRHQLGSVLSLYRV